MTKSRPSPGGSGKKRQNLRGQRTSIGDSPNNSSGCSRRIASRRNPKKLGSFNERASPRLAPGCGRGGPWPRRMNHEHIRIKGAKVKREAARDKIRDEAGVKQARN